MYIVIILERNKIYGAFQTYLTMGSFYSEHLLGKTNHRIYFGNADYTTAGRTHQNIWNLLRHLKTKRGASLVAQWLRIRLPMQGTGVQALVQEDPTCRGASKPVHHNY